MARPLKEGMDYFPHDTDAISDEKIDRLRMLFGNDGYAFYFILLERIYRSATFEIDVSAAETIQILARKVEVTPEKFDELLKAALKGGCFCQKAYDERRVLTSNGVKKRSEIVVGKRQRMADRYRKELEEVSAAETQQKDDKVKKSKEKKSKPISSASDDASGDSPKPYTITHQLRLVMEGLNPKYYWEGKEAKAAKSLANKLANGIRNVQGIEPTDSLILDAFRQLYNDSRKLPPFYQFTDMSKFNQEYNKLVEQIHQHKTHEQQTPPKKQVVI